jgi:DNA-binding NarL/FixJ family response regulator
VLVLTAHDVDGYLAAMVEAGAAGFVVKEEAPETIVESCAAHRGERCSSAASSTPAPGAGARR